MSAQSSIQTIATRDGFKLGFLERGNGVPCVLLHAIGASAELNWLEPGIVDHLADNGLRVVALDFRGHGQSERPPEPSAYSLAALMHDAEDVITGLDLGPCHLAGYSLGALVAAHIAASGVVPLLSVVLAGIDTDTITFDTQAPELIDATVDALLAPDLDSIADPAMQGYRMQLEAWGADPKSVASILRDLHIPHPIDLGTIDVPTLVINGEGDSSPAEIGDLIRGAQTATVQGDHLTAPLDPSFAQLMRRFLLERSPS